ncbi:hypothetical protein CRENBAI_000664 [Crenichthys baileyi]|uniref:Ig-like domain-containing protein n=1 Tax=Crenichthys baileyi TaxID=28760 RepID=A0AAV9R635_9TELE
MSSFISMRMLQFLLLLFPLTAVSVEYSSLIIDLGEEATLPCVNMMNSRHKCDSVTWSHVASGHSSAVRLAHHGQIDGSLETRSDRLGLTGDCSLLIKNVTARDVGMYTCRESAPQQEGRHFQVHLAVSSKNIIKSTAETELPTSTPMSSTAQQDCCCSAVDYIIFVIHLAEVFLVTFIPFHFFSAQGKDKVADTSVLNSVTRRLVNHSGVESMSHDEEDCTANYVNFRSPAPAAKLNIQQEHHIC